MIREDLIEIVFSQGFFCILFTCLLWYVLTENAKREERYQEIINNLSNKFEILDFISEKIVSIEDKLL